MEGGSRSGAYKSIRSYWRRRTYQRLEGLPLKQQPVRVSRLGGGSRASRTSRRSWKVRPVLRMVMSAKAFSPARLLARLRDAYVDAMLALAGGEARPSVLKKAGAPGGQVVSWERRMPKAREMGRGGGDFEQRMMLHIYRSLVAPPEVIGS